MKRQITKWWSVLSLGAIGSAGWAQETALEAEEEADSSATTFTFETDFSTRYLFRGLPASEGAVVQPSLFDSRKGYTLGIWGNMPLSRRDGPRQLNEVDLSLSRTIERGRTSIEPM